MAKWGEGDPRWIVEERPDATNVNNWHWTEKNATTWSKERLHQLFNNFNIKEDDIDCCVEAVDKITGEATVNNRKGKLIFFYDWEIVLKWSGCLPKNSNLKHNGKVTIPNLSEENDMDDVEITITIDESNDESEALKQFMYNVGREKIRIQLSQYIKELKEQYSKNLILPKKSDDENVRVKTEQPIRNTCNTNAQRNLVKSIAPVTSGRADPIGCKLDVRTLVMTEKFQCSANDIYNALTKVEMLNAFTRSNATVDASKGGEFHLYGGSVQGKFEELLPEKRIVQSWRLKSWPMGHYSNVQLEFEEKKSYTQLSLKQTGIPASEYESMRSNWHRYYWTSIKQTFGFGSDLLDSL